MDQDNNDYFTNPNRIIFFSNKGFIKLIIKLCIIQKLFLFINFF
jgi:hypothetical protein